MSLKLYVWSTIPQFWHVRDGLRHLLKRVVADIENFHVLHVCDCRWELRDFVVAKGEPGDVFHGPEPGHVVQVDQVLVAEVNLGIGHLLGLVQSLSDHFLTHLWAPLLLLDVVFNLRPNTCSRSLLVLCMSVQTLNLLSPDERY